MCPFDQSYLVSDRSSESAGSNGPKGQCKAMSTLLPGVDMHCTWYVSDGVLTLQLPDGSLLQTIVGVPHGFGSACDQFIDMVVGWMVRKL